MSAQQTGATMSEAPEEPRPSDKPYWATGTTRLHVEQPPAGAINLNVEGRMLAGPIQGFGKMWQKTYRVRLEGAAVSPVEVISVWKARFPEFWPPGNRFYAPLTGIAPGEVALLNLRMPGRQKLSTGVLVLYSDDESFTLMTPEGHMLAGWITFSAHDDGGTTVAQAQVLIRASDPVYEIGLILFGHKQEDRFWVHTLTQLGAHFDISARPDARTTCIDTRRQWRRAGNIRHNAAIRTGIYTLMRPLRMAGRTFRRDEG